MQHSTLLSLTSQVPSQAGWGRCAGQREARGHAARNRCAAAAAGSCGRTTTAAPRCAGHRPGSWPLRCILPQLPASLRCSEQPPRCTASSCLTRQAAIPPPHAARATPSAALTGSAPCSAIMRPRPPMGVRLPAAALPMNSSAARARQPAKHCACRRIVGVGVRPGVGYAGCCRVAAPWLLPPLPPPLRRCCEGKRLCRRSSLRHGGAGQRAVVGRPAQRRGARAGTLWHVPQTRQRRRRLPGFSGRRGRAAAGFRTLAPP